MFLNSTSSFPQTQAMNSSRYSDHKSKMSMINGPIKGEVMGALSKRAAEDTSPYSILRRSPNNDLRESLQSLEQLQSHNGGKLTRSLILRQLALKEKFMSNPGMFMKTKKVLKADADQMAMDPLINVVRKRNRRGEYESFDRNQSKTAGMVENRASDLHPNSDINKAENRLRVIEQISKFREEKIKREFLKLEEELRLEEEKNQKKMRREMRAQEYFRQQKEKLAEYQKVKMLRQQEESKLKREEEEKDQIKDNQRRLRNEANVSK
jgi:hypothetical protein